MRSRTEDLLLRLPSVLVPVVYSFLAPAFKLLQLSHLSHAHVPLLTPACFQQDQLVLTPPSVLHLLSSSLSHAARSRLHPLPPHLLLSTVPSLTLIPSPQPSPSIHSDLSLHLPPSSPSSPSSSSPLPLFPSLLSYSQQVACGGFHSPSLLSTHLHLTSLHVDTVRYDLDATLALSSTLTPSLHTLSLRALLALTHIDLILSLPSLTHLDLTGSTVIKIPPAHHDDDPQPGGAAAHGLFQSDSLVASSLAAQALLRLVHLSLPVGEQRLEELVALLQSASPHRLQSLRVDESPVSAECVRSMLRLQSLTSLQLHTHTIHFDATPWAELSDAALPAPRQLRRLCFLGDHDSRASCRVTPYELAQSVLQLLSSFASLEELELSLPTSVPLPLLLPSLLRMRRLQLLALSRGYGAWRPVHAEGELLEEELAGANLVELRVATFSFLDDLYPSALSTLLAHAPRLTSLQLTHCDRLGLETLLAVGQQCPALQQLHISYCTNLHLTAEGWDTALEAPFLASPRAREQALFPLLKEVHLDLPHPHTAVVDDDGLQQLVQLLARSPLSVLSLSSPLLSPQLLLLSPLPHLSSLGSTFSHSSATLASALYHSPAHTHRVFQREPHSRAAGGQGWSSVFWDGEGDDGMTGRERFFHELRQRLLRGELDEPVKQSQAATAARREQQRSGTAVEQRRRCCSRCAVM